jgi:hypothetical protein
MQRYKDNINGKTSVLYNVIESTTYDLDIIFIHSLSIHALVLIK